VADLIPQRWKNVEEVFEAVLRLPPPERPAFLEQACGNDLRLRNQVETLLLSLDRAASLKEVPQFGVALSQTVLEEIPPTMIGKRLGSYRIEREIGRGGMGSVYLAVRADDEFDKRVAIKLIKRGMDTDFIVRRFRNERQILASLDHPNIARLLDGGTTEDSLPYFVMEYVEGQPIYQYCDDHRLSIADRLKLFRKVCAAVHYAHENLVIHRDLKPNNILVTAAAAPKLLDFGIAKLLNPDMSSQALDPTTAAVRLMTPEYASPEQVRGETISAVSDVYCLGVLLYELLTDHRPYRINSHQPHELTHAICETEPDLPSVAVNLIEVFPVEGREPTEITPETVSKARSTTPDQLRRELSGSLDNIILKAMRKEPQKRYSSVEEFSDDIGRYLEGQPVSAPSYFPSPAKSEVDTGEPATDSRSLAVLPFQVLRVEEKSDEFLGMGLTDAIITKLSNLHQIMVRPTSAVAKYFDGTHNILAAGHELNVGYVLDGRIQRAGDRLRLTVQLVRMRDGNPLWAAKFDENYTDIFTVEDSISEQVANALVPRLSGEEREMLLKRETEDSNAYQAFLKGRYFWNRFTPEDFAKALEQFREAIRLDPRFAQAHVGIADYYNWAAIFGLGTPTENFFEAKAAAIRALELDESLAEAHAALAFTNLCYDWDWEGAEHRFKRSLELNPNYGPAHQWYSNLLAAQGRFDEAIAAIKRAQEINPLSLMDRSIGGWTYYHARCYQLAEQESKATLEIDRNFSNSHLMLGFVYERLGRYDESIQELELCLELMPGSPVPLCPLGYALASSGRKEMALQIVERLKKLSQEMYVSPYFIALIYTGLGNHEAAFEWLEKACESRDEWMLWLGTEPKFDPIRSDPRFEGLLKRVGLTGDETARAISYSGEHGVNLRASHLQAGDSGKRKSGSSTGEIEPASPTLADAVFAVHRDHRREHKGVLAVAALLGLLVAGFLGYRFMQKPAANFTTTTLEKLTATGNVIDAAISGDGKYVAFIMDEGGKQGLSLRQRAIANSIRLVAPAAVEYKGLVFSQDGNYVYYVSREKNAGHGSLYQVPALGGSVRELKNDVDSPIGVSPDEKQIAFVRSDTEKGEDVLVVADEKGGNEHPLATRRFPERFSQLTAPVWSLDGNMIVSVTQSSDSNGFYLRITGMPIAGGDEVSLSARRWLEISRMARMPGGSGLILSAHDSSSAFHHLWLINSSGGPDQRITSDLNDYLTVSISSSPLVLLSVQRQTLTNIWVAPSDQPAQSVQVSSGAGRFFDLRWTSDGKMLYASDASGNADIWEMDADGTNQKQLTAGASRNYAPVASPDGRYVIFHSNRSGRWQIWRMNRDGGNQTQLTEGQEDSNWPEFSGDGRWIFYQHMHSGTPTLWKVPVDGGTPVQITSTLSMRPAVSPDGTSIAYWRREQRPDAPWRIAISSLDAQPSVRFLEVAQTPANGKSALRWSADGRSILYISAGNDVTKLTGQSLEGGPEKDLASFSKEQFYSFDQSDDGRYVYSRGLRTSDAVIITNSR
jgi:serine/threonine protein kinase/Tol biopolymer transport system component/tetratricopeptide (TPR) repeat protein